MEIVSKQDYWITILNDLTQFGQISTEDAKFNEIADYVWRVLQNTLILTEDEKQIKHWEDIVNVSGEGLTQFQRKVNLLFLLSEKSYIPMNLLRKALNKLLGEGEYILNVDDENNKIYLGFSNYPIKGKVDFLLSKTVPSYYENEIEADKLPKDYLPADFLETTGTQTLRVDSLVDNEFGLYFDVVATNETAANNFALSMQTNEGGYKNIRIGSGTNAGLTWWTGGSVKVPWGASVFNKRVLWQANFKNSRLLATDSEFGHAENTMKDIGTVSDCLPIGKAAYVEGGIFKNWMNYPSYIKVYSVKTSRGEAVTHNLVPALDSSGTPCMYDKMTNQTIYNSDSGQFVIGLTMHQAINLDKLPNGDGELTVSLSREAQLVQHNAEVEAALETARLNGWLLKVQYHEPEAESAIYNKYNTCTTVAEMRAVNADYQNDLTADGEWIYPLERIVNPDYMFWQSASLKKIVLSLPNATTAGRILSETTNMTEAELIFGGQNLIDCHDTISRGSKTKRIKVWNVGSWVGASCFHSSPALEEFEFEAQTVTGLHEWFYQDRKLKRVQINDVSKVTAAYQTYVNCVSLEEFPTAYPALSNGDLMFSGCLLKKQHAIEVLNGIPAWTSGTHKLTIGIHVDYQTDAEVLAAIEAAEVKGWTMTVQWNGTAGTSGASTFGLRRPTIYAKVATMDMPDSVSKRSLDWGHYVTNWEENGYQEFASVEDAREYFNIEETQQ